MCFRYAFVRVSQRLGGGGVGVYGMVGFCLVVLNYFKYCIIHLFQIGMCGKKTKGI